MASFVSIINHNEKSGKTIIAFNLAAALALCDKKTLFINTYDNPNSDSEFILKHQKFEFDLFYNSPLKNLLKYDSVHTYLINLDFLTIDTDLNGVEDENRIDLIASLKDELKNNYEFIIADSPTGLSGGIDLFFEISDKYIVPLEVESYAFDSLTPLFAKADWFKKKDDSGPRFHGFLLNRVDESSKLKDIFQNMAFYFFGSHVLDRIIPYDELIDTDLNPSGSILDDLISLSGHSFLNFAKSFYINNQEDADEGSK